MEVRPCLSLVWPVLLRILQVEPARSRWPFLRGLMGVSDCFPGGLRKPNRYYALYSFAKISGLIVPSRINKSVALRLDQRAPRL